METIKTYLENMFGNLPKSSEVEKAKIEILSMMEDKYMELKAENKTENEAIGIVISEFGNLEELVNDLGITCNMHKEKEMYHTRVLTLDEVKTYIEDTVSFGWKIGIGVMLCIFSPILLIIMIGLAESGVMGIKENTAALVGVIGILAFITIAIGLFIFYGSKLEKYEYLKRESFRLELGVEAYVKELKETFEPTNTLYITIGVILCILSVVPVIVAALGFEHTSSLIIMIGVAILLFMIGIGVFLFIATDARFECYKILLQEEEYAVDRKGNKFINIISSIYWPLITLIYLAWSFTSHNWAITWIIWPIAGVLFSVISNICIAMHNKNEKKEPFI